MKPQELVTLALRVLSVFVASRAFVYLADAAVFLVVPAQNQGGIPFPVLALLSLLGPGIAAIVIWWCAPHLARLAARDISDVPIATLNAQSIISATFVAAGTLIFIIALPALVSNAIRAFSQPGLLVVPSLLASALQCFLGVLLVFGCRVTSRLLLWLRYAGTGARGL